MIGDRNDRRRRLAIGSTEMTGSSSPSFSVVQICGLQTAMKPALQNGSQAEMSGATPGAEGFVFYSQKDVMTKVMCEFQWCGPVQEVCIAALQLLSPQQRCWSLRQHLHPLQPRSQVCLRFHANFLSYVAMGGWAATC